MNILIDENMPYAHLLFSQFGTVTAKSGRTLCADDLVDIDALMIRSVTKVNDVLLAKANKLRFIGTATAGVDHVDQVLLSQKGIKFANASGCNKIGVAEYFLSALLTLAELNDFLVTDKVVGIVGAGEVGSYLSNCLSAIGIQVLLCDPFKQAQGDPRVFISLDELLSQADVITLHTPITMKGEHATYHLLDQQRLEALRCDQILINAARGAVVDGEALKQRLKRQDGFVAVLDVFEFEPFVDEELVPYLKFATPHIAGYGLEGKARGSLMIYEAYCQFIGKTPTLSLEQLLPNPLIEQVQLTQAWDQSLLHRLTQLIYDIRTDDAAFRRCFAKKDGFDQLRKEYWDRREYNSLTLLGHKNCQLNSLQGLGFKIKEV